MKKNLETARSFEKENTPDRELRPAFHYYAPAGWINDPNGFSWFGGKAHLFAQYHPFSNKWGPMHWAHQTTEDFLNWKVLPAALAPDQPYDELGCYSGSAIESDGKHILMYTGVSEKDKQEVQQQCIAIGDGLNYIKLKENPVIAASEIPEGFSKRDFRDPKIWKEKDRYYCVMGSLNEKKQGQAIVFSSGDLISWDYEGVMADSQGTLGEMWECPDFFVLDSVPVLIVSPQDMQARGLEFHNGHNSVWLTGPYQDHHFDGYEANQLDYGLDFYAPQTMLHPDGRRIMTAWMASWDNPLFKKNFDWAGQMILPRELSMENGRLIQRPVREIENFRTDPVRIEETELSGIFTDERIRGRCCELIVRFKGEQRDLEEFVLKTAFDQKKGLQTLFIWNRLRKRIEFDRTFSGMTADLNAIRKAEAPEDGIQELRVILDRYSEEIFINDGQMVLSNALPADLSADGIEIEVMGKCLAEIEFYTIDVQKEK